MKMVKTVAAVAALAIGTAAFADELTVGGYWRTEEYNVINDNGDDDPVAEFFTVDDAAGYNLGIGNDRLRVDVDYSSDDGNAGVTFRYEANDNVYELDTSLAYAMGHLKFVNGLFDVEAGILTDNYTGTNGANGYAFDGVRGARLVVLPVEGLALTAQVGTEEDNVNYTKDLVSLSASYSNEKFAVQGGYKLDGSAYYGFDLTAVENLTFTVDGTFASKDVSEAQNEKGEDVAAVHTDVTLSYAAGNVVFGTAAELDFVEDANVYAFYPFVEVALDNVKEGLSAGLDVGITKADEEEADNVLKITPEVSYAIGNAKLQGFYTLSTDLDEDDAYHAIGLGLQYAF